MEISDLISEIKHERIVVPEFQREFVWNRSRSKELIDSLLNKYPVGGILLWKTNEPPHLKGETFKNEQKNNGIYEVLLDGQQRTTALYMLINDEIPPYYNESEIGDDPRNLAYNLQSRELKYWNSASMEQNGPWQLVTEIMKGAVEPATVAVDIHQKFAKLNDVLNFDFDFDIPKENRTLGRVRTLIESTGINIKHSSQQMWKIFLPSKTVDVTYAELANLHVGSVRSIPENEWTEEDHKVDKDRFLEFWKSKVIPDVEQLIKDNSDISALVTLFTVNGQHLKNIKNFDIFKQSIPETATFSDAIDIFDKINSQGVHLSNGDLALTHITAIWPDARRKMKEFKKELSSKNFDFNLTFMTRLLILASCGRASLSSLSALSYEPIRELSEVQLSSAWNTCESVFTYLIDVLCGEKITNSEFIRSKNVLLPLFYYVLKNGGSFETEQQRKLAIYWFHNSLIWGRYAGSSDQKLEEDIQIIKTFSENVWSELLGKIVDQRGRLKIEPSDLEGQGSDGRLFNTFHVMLKHYGAQDWVTGVSLDSPENSGFSTDRHHIFPKSLLKTAGYSDQNKIQKALINEISNIAIITNVTNKKISDKSPSHYLPKIRDKYPSALKNQLIPDRPDLWETDKYLNFLISRRELIAENVNSFLETYRTDDVADTSEPNVETLCTMLESELLEFKETFQFDIRKSIEEEKDIKNKELHLACIKTVAGFMNSNGGDLIIGVSDNKDLNGLERVEGLDRDLIFMNKASSVGDKIDQLEQTVSQVLVNALGPSKIPHYTIKFPEIEDKFICHVHVNPCRSSKTWVNFHGKQQFYVRDCNGTRLLDGHQADEYWSERKNT
jgi:hypothetical protein